MNLTSWVNRIPEKKVIGISASIQKALRNVGEAESTRIRHDVHKNLIQIEANHAHPRLSLQASDMPGECRIEIARELSRGSLIDSTKAADLGLARALFHNEYEGTLETFRPYALPDQEWLESVASRFEKREAAAHGR